MLATKKIQRNDNTALYEGLRGEESNPIDLIVFGRRSLWCFSDADQAKFLIDGRPRELSDIGIATWSLLTSAVKEYRDGTINKMARRHFCLFFVVVYGAIFLPMLFLPDDFDERDNGWFVTFFSSFAWFVAMVLLVVWIRYRTAKALNEEFHPNISRLVDELSPKFAEAGFEIEYVVASTHWTPKSFIRFIPIEGEIPPPTMTDAA